MAGENPNPETAQDPQSEATEQPNPAPEGEESDKSGGAFADPPEDQQDGKSPDEKSDKETQDDDGKKAEDKPLHGAPEAYEAFEVPEGVKPDEASLTRFHDLARELNLSQAGAQKLVDMQLQYMGQMAEQQRQAWADQMEQWVDEVKKDPVVGGVKYKHAMADCRAVLSKFGGPELGATLKQYGFDNYLPMVKFITAVAKATGVDRDIPVPGGGDNPPGGGARVLRYGNSETE